MLAAFVPLWTCGPPVAGVRAEGWRSTAPRAVRSRRHAAKAEEAGASRVAAVIGAGPAGLAAALMLAKRRWRVRLYERSANPAAYDPGKGFMYLIDGRGQHCLKSLNVDLFERLVDESVAMADAKIGVLTPEGLTERVNPIKDAARKSYWIPRHAFVGILLDEVRRCEDISLHLESGSLSLSQRDAGFRIGDEEGDVSLLVGADGYRSTVRERMEEWDGGKGNFEVKEFSSPSAGLRYKVLTLPGSFELDTPAGPETFSSEGFYAIRGASKKRRKQKLGLIPVSQQFGTRTANLITYEDDEVWEAETLEQFKAYAQDQWPHFPLEDLVSEEEFKRFAENRGGRFPSPQHCASAVWRSNGAVAVLLGDALHSLPPDIGQGVNSALEDVSVCAACLDAQDDASAAALDFEKRRMPDVKALIRIVRVAAPFQYSQAPWRGRLWNVSFLSRLLLNKLLPKVFDLPLFLQIQQSELSYSEVWRRGSRGARRASALGLLLAGGSRGRGCVMF